MGDHVMTEFFQAALGLFFRETIGSGFGLGKGLCGRKRSYADEPRGNLDGAALALRGCAYVARENGASTKRHECLQNLASLSRQRIVIRDRSHLNVQPNAGYYDRTPVAVIAGIVDVLEVKCRKDPGSERQRKVVVSLHDLFRA